MCTQRPHLNQGHSDLGFKRKLALKKCLFLFDRGFFSRISRTLFSSPGILIGSKDRPASGTFFHKLQSTFLMIRSFLGTKLWQTAILIPNVVAHLPWLLPSPWTEPPYQTIRYQNSMLSTFFGVSLTLNVPLVRAQLCQELACNIDPADSVH